MATGSSVRADPPPTPEWEEGGGGAGDAARWKDWLQLHSQGFDWGVQDLKAKLDAAFREVVQKPSDPTALANYQTALASYSMFRTLQSNSAKSLADMQKQNARNLG